MIRIRPSPISDKEIATKVPTKEELMQSTTQHIGDVQRAIAWFCYRLISVGAIHDHTKIDDFEAFYETYAQGLIGDAFRESEWYQSHLQERHHINERCPEDLTLLDILERIADIVVAGIARNGTFYDDDLDPEILAKAYKNTIDLLIQQIELID